MQRICSAAHFAIDATAIAAIASLKISERFKSCRADCLPGDFFLQQLVAR